MYRVKILCGGGPSSALVWVGDVGGDLPYGEVPLGIPPPGGPADGGHGPQTPIEQDMGISAHCGGAGDSGTKIYWCLYRPPSEHGYTIHCHLFYNRLVSGSGAEASNAAFAEMVGEACSICPRDKSSACIIVD